MGSSATVTLISINDPASLLHVIVEFFHSFIFSDCKAVKTLHIFAFMTRHIFKVQTDLSSEQVTAYKNRFQSGYESSFTTNKLSGKLAVTPAK